MEQAVKENSITQGVIWKQLLIFFFPILIGTFFQQLYNTVDTIVVGQYVGTNALAAVGTTGTLINLLVGFFVIGQPYGLLLALVLAVMDFIPIIGAGTVMVPWAVVDLFMGNYFHAVQLMVIWGAIALFRRVEWKPIPHTVEKSIAEMEQDLSETPRQKSA